MVVEPRDTVLTRPVDPMLATDGLLLDHTPPDVELVNVAAEPRHAPMGPDIGMGMANTVTVCVTKHPVGSVYVMRPTPPDMPVTTPVAKATVINAVLLDDHIPPPVALLKVIVVPGHMVWGPMIADGFGATVTVLVVKHPEESV